MVANAVARAGASVTLGSFSQPAVHAFPTPHARSEFVAGARTAAPILVGTVPFGFVAGVAGVAAGLSPFESIALSVLAFSGVAQLMTAQLLAAGSPVAVVVFAVFVLSLRHLMYSAALAPHFAHLSVRWRCLLAYLMTDQGFAMSARQTAGEDARRDHHWRFLGFAALLYATWQTAVIIGTVAGTQVPPEWSLDFVVVLTFLALLVPTVRTRADLAAAIVSGAAVLLAAGMPYKLALVVASLAGIAAGLAVEAGRGR